MGAALFFQNAMADVKLPAVFSSHMVVQRDAPIPVWGTADPGETVTVSMAGQTKVVEADKTGRWIVRLGELSAGGPHTLTVEGKNTVSVRDVLVGEVWLASGQSNMVHIMPYSKGYSEELTKADYPNIRIFTVARSVVAAPQQDCKVAAGWRLSNAESVDDYSAVSYYFARDLHKILGVPVGVITSALGSSPIESWTSFDAQAGRPELKELLASWDRKRIEYNAAAAAEAYARDREKWEEAARLAQAAGKPLPREPKTPVAPVDQPQQPAVLFNGMIAPLIPYGIRGVIWYQGEYNAQTEDYARLYRVQLPLMIEDWRTRWGQTELPFAWVQLPNFDTTTREPVMTGWPLVREGQLLALAVPRTGMAVTIDIGEAGSVHPTNKAAFAHRLALWARSEVYGERIPWSGPLFVQSKTAAREIELSFRHVDGGLVAGGGGPLRGFVVAGEDKKWVPAVARISGDKILVSGEGLERPVYVRYSWAANPDGNLCNGAGLPASPFRTHAD
jgi:hypothetical protein